MAKQVKLQKGKEFEFKATTKGGESKYPWAEWLNGELLMLEQSLGTKDDKGTVVTIEPKGKRDYEVDTNLMPAKVKFAARKQYKVVQISRLDADGKKLKDSLIIRARPMTDAERDDEDLLRAEDREVAIARRAKLKNQPKAEAPQTLGPISAAI